MAHISSGLSRSTNIKMLSQSPLDRKGTAHKQHVATYTIPTPFPWKVRRRRLQPHEHIIMACAAFDPRDVFVFTHPDSDPTYPSGGATCGGGGNKHSCRHKTAKCSALLGEKKRFAEQKPAWRLKTRHPARGNGFVTKNCKQGQPRLT